ncbi:MAG TPA: hypothetical protein DCZ62_09735 [Ruminococcus sp.]|nr:hypothetical protein [Ruminococcus sp.]
MKLAEALQERKDLNSAIAQLKTRLYSNATVQEGEKPAEDPQELLKDLEAACDRLEELIVRINNTNDRTLVGDKTLAQLIVKRDLLSLRINTYRDLAQQSSNLAYRASGTEIKILSTLSVPELQKKIDRLCKELRETDNSIQAQNWMTELL